MGKVLLGTPVYSDPSELYTPTVAGGAYNASYPVANVLDSRLSKVARSTNALEANTSASFDLKTPRDVRVVAVPKHNLSSAGKWRAVAPPAENIFTYVAGMDIAALGGVFARTSVATYVDRNGLVRSVASGVPRDAHYVDGRRTLLMEGSTVNYVTFGRVFDSGYWTLTSMTAATTQVGIDGAANAASLLTATAGNATAHRLITGSLLDKVFSVYVKRVTGTGVIELSQDNGVTWVAIVPTAEWTRFSISQNIGNSTLRIRIVTSGDAIAVDGAQYEYSRTVATSVLFTEGGTVTRASESLYFDAPALNPARSMSVYARFTELAPRAWVAEGGMSQRIVQIGGAADSGARFIAYKPSSTSNYQVWYDNGTTNRTSAVAITPAIGDEVEVHATLDATAGQARMHACKNGGAVTSGTLSTALTMPATWGGTRVWVGSMGTNGGGNLALSEVSVSEGVTTLESMRSLVYDTGWLDAWAAGETLETRSGLNRALVHLPPSTLGARQYWTLMFSDEANAAGYVEVARVVLAGGYEPSSNFSYGTTFGYKSGTKRIESGGDEVYFAVRGLRRILRMRLEHQLKDEAFEQALAAHRVHGTSRQLFVVPDVESTGALLSTQAFLAVMDELPPLEWVVADRHAVPFSLIEEL